MPSLDFHPTVPVFDANIGVGHRHDRVAPFAGPAELSAQMKAQGVDRALVYHVQGETISAIDGNNALLAWVGDHDGFTPQWMANPNQACLAQLQTLRQEGRLSSVRLHSTTDSHLSFSDWIYGDLLDWLADADIPLWVSLADTPADQIAATLGQYPQLRTVLVGAHYMHAMAVRPLLRRLPNAHIELSRYEKLGGVEELRDEFGAERLLYGSYYPRYAMGPILYYLHTADFSTDELAAVCAGNLERILLKAIA